MPERYPGYPPGQHLPKPASLSRGHSRTAGCDRLQASQPQRDVERLSWPLML